MQKVRTVGYACIQALQRLFKIFRFVQNVQRFADGQGFIRRAFNVSDIRQYISRVDEMAQRKRDLFLGGNAPASCKSENVPENA